ncbi:hypothetical protein BZG36_02290 [Bifiguratus adelaidae]|uniref:Uncharacterized protein n=1 Tax=Bifiguratus adelaidae TaxID=1938954 RepID=A0A261Y3U3_9FUNG|nr:hypothetical protein BZG36_02290 [Bifiguratus adelaidae]
MAKDIRDVPPHRPAKSRFRLSAQSLSDIPAHGQEPDARRKGWSPDLDQQLNQLIEEVSSILVGHDGIPGYLEDIIAIYEEPEEETGSTTDSATSISTQTAEQRRTTCNTPPPINITQFILPFLRDECVDQISHTSKTTFDSRASHAGAILAKRDSILAHRRASHFSTLSRSNSQATPTPSSSVDGSAYSASRTSLSSDRNSTPQRPRHRCAPPPPMIIPPPRSSSISRRTRHVQLMRTGSSMSFSSSGSSESSPSTPTYIIPALPL